MGCDRPCNQIQYSRINSIMAFWVLLSTLSIFCLMSLLRSLQYHIAQCNIELHPTLATYQSGFLGAKLARFWCDKIKSYFYGWCEALKFPLTISPRSESLTASSCSWIWGSTGQDYYLSFNYNLHETKQDNNIRTHPFLALPWIVCSPSVHHLEGCSSWTLILVSFSLHPKVWGAKNIISSNIHNN